MLNFYVLDDGINPYIVILVSVFGSVARGEPDEQSDIGLVVSFSKRISLVQMVALERQFSDILGRKVDLLTEAAISPYLQEKNQARFAGAL